VLPAVASSLHGKELKIVNLTQGNNFFEIATQGPKVIDGTPAYNTVSQDHGPDPHKHLFVRPLASSENSASLSAWLVYS
jgi:hypothetical protein